MNASTANGEPWLCIQVVDFLPADQHAALLAYALSKGNEFSASTVDNEEREHRRSLIHHDLGTVSGPFLERIRASLPQAAILLSMPWRPVTEIECQLTAHNDGHFYKLHNDNGTPGTRSRALSYVYYFNREPKVFTGGELQIFRSKVENGFYVPDEKYQLVAPVNNSIVFFQSYHHHQVLPIICASRDHADSRLTLNGWVRT